MTGYALTYFDYIAFKYILKSADCDNSRKCVVRLAQTDNGVAAVDKKHQIIIDATAFGEGQEYHTLAPVLDKISKRYKRLSINDDIYSTGVVVTADTGFSNQDNMKYLYDEQINAYIPDNNFRKRDKKFTGQKKKYVRPSRAKKDFVPTLPSSEFSFDP